MRILSGTVTALVVAGGMVCVAGAGTASAQQLSRTFGYTCTPFAAGTHSFTVKITTALPDEVVVGRPGRTLTVQAVATAEASVTKWLADSGMSTVEGTVDASAHVDAPRKQLDIPAPFRMTRTTAPSSGPFKIRATAEVTTPTFDHPGKATVTTGNIALHILAKNASGTMWLSADTSCSLKAGQSNIVTSFDITTASSKPSATPKPTTGPVDSTTPRHTTGPVASTAPKHTTGPATPAAPGRTNGPVAADVPKPTVPKGHGPTTERGTTPGAPRVETSGVTEDNSTPATPSSVEPTSVANSPATGHGLRDLLLPGASVLIACGAAFFLGMRLRNRRAAGGDGGRQQPLGPTQGLPTAGGGDGALGIGHRRRTNSTVRRSHGHVHGEPPYDSTGRSVTANGNLLLGRHAPSRSDHRTSGARAGDDADLGSRLSDLSTAKEVNATIHEEPGTATARRA